MTLLFVVASVSEGSGAQLYRISASGSPVSTRIHAYFDALPGYQEHISNRRLDLLLYDTQASLLTQELEPNEVISKTLVVQEQDDTRLSLFFRYVPQELSITATPDNVLIIDLIPGNRFTGVYRELESNLGLLTQVEPGQHTLINPLTFSPYKNNWRSFFKESYTLPLLAPVPAPTVPPFPLTALLFPGDARHLPFLDGVDSEEMFESLQQIQKGLKSINNEEERKYYAISHADLLFRLGSVEAALAQYKLLADRYGNDDAGHLATFGAALIEMGERRFHLARVRLTNLLERLPTLHPLAPHARLAVAETLLATGRYAEMDRLLERETFPPSLDEPVALRQADLAAATGNVDEAFLTYERLFATEALRSRPYSINHYCSILFNRQAYEESGRCYLDLASMLGEAAESGAARYFAALAEFKSSDTPARSKGAFDFIAKHYPGTEAALLAEMKQADICIMTPDLCAEVPSRWFRRIADRASSRDLAEAALFREALAYFLEGQRSSSINVLQTMLRTFQSGELLDQAQALLIQLLPGRIEELLDSGLDLEAIALAQQNRHFFEKGWLDDALLFRIGLAFDKLAMHPEALQLFLYLKNRPFNGAREDLLIAAIRSAHALGIHPLVEDLASEYTYRYPQGTYGLDVLFYRLDCTYAAGRIDEALLMLPDPVPQRLDFQLLEAALAFQKNRYRRTADILLPLYRGQQEVLTEDLLFMLAESLYELGESPASQELFGLLAASGKYERAAGLRLVQLSGSRASNKFPESGVDLSAGAEGDDPWQRLSALDTRYRQLLSNL